ncbi:MAG: TolC family protein [Spirochaetia bacterium]|nr:TolC family protein [Spirochaetia bacterium]
MNQVRALGLKGVFAAFLAGSAVFAEEPKVLDLAALKKLALERNTDYRQQKNLKEIAGNAFTSAKSQFFWPGLSLSLFNNSPGVSLLGPPSQTLYFSESPKYNSSGTYTGQTSNATVDLFGAVILEEKLPLDATIKGYIASDLNLFGAVTNVFSAGINWRQPLLPLLRRSEIDFQRALTEKELRSQNDALTQKERDTLNALEVLYYDLALIRSSLRVSDNKRNKSKQNLVDTQKKFTAGLINEVDALRITLNDHVIQNAYELFVQDERDKKLEILNLVQIDPAAAVEIKTIDPLETAAPGIRTDVIYDLDKSIAVTLSNEYTVRDQEYALWKDDEAYRKEKEKYGLTGDLSFALSRDFIPQTNFQVSLSVNLQTPILDRGEYLRSKASHLLRRDTILREREQVVMGIRKDITQKTTELTEIARQFQTAKENRDIAAKIYQMDQRRFELGLITSDILITTESDYFTRELDLIKQAVRWTKALNFLEYRYRMVKR